MFNWLRKRRLSGNARKKLLIVAARSEEAIIETHVANLLELLDALGEEVDLDRGLELYFEMMSLDEGMASAVTNRLLARLGGPASRPPSRAGREGGRYRNAFREERRP